MTRLLGILALVGLASLCGGEARAQSGDPPQTETDAERRGRELYENGALLYDEGRYEDAIVAWQAAYDLTQRSGFLFNIANAYERLAKYEEAIDVLGRYRALARAEERETLDRRIRNLEERQAEQARAEPDRPVPVPAPSGPGPEPEPEPVQRTGSLRPVVGYTLVGTGAASLATGLGFALSSRAAGVRAEEGCRPLESGLLCPSSASDALGANHRSALVADMGFGAGLALATSGVIVLLTGHGGHEDGGSVSVTPMRRGITVAMTW